MSSFIDALDKNLQFGEKGHVEVAWCEHNYDELITQFFFQLVRSDEEGRNDLEEKLRFLLENLSWENDSEKMSVLYKLIAQTRDIVKGKGEYTLSFMQIAIWWDYYPTLAFAAFKLFVKGNDNPLDHQYGSWKDIKYMCNYLAEKHSRSHPLIHNIIVYAAVSLQSEWVCWNRDKDSYRPGLIGRWLPREKSKKFGWIHGRIANVLFPQFIQEPKNGWKSQTQLSAARTKQKIHLTKMLTVLSKATDTPQIKMCDPKGRWNELKFNNVTSITLRKQKNAILNKTKKNAQRSDKEDRIQCANNYKEHLAKAVSGDKTAKIHGKRCSVGELVKDALGCWAAVRGDAEYDTINQQWESNKSNNKGLEDKPIVSVVDTSGSMECDDGIPLYNAIGLGIRCSEICHPAFRNRMLTFNAKPTWIKFKNENGTEKTSEEIDQMTFVDKVKAVRKADWGMNTDFHLALDKILEALVANNVDPKSVRDLVLAVFSDMQFDCSYHNAGVFDTAAEAIARKFAEAGLKTSWRRPYDPPHVLFWNLRKTTGFPSTTCTKNTTFLSGYSSVLLDVFCEKGFEALREASPMLMLSDLVNNTRYDPMDDIIKNTVMSELGHTPAATSGHLLHMPGSNTTPN